MCVNNLPKVATRWNSGTTQESNPGPRVRIPSALTTKPLSHMYCCNNVFLVNCFGYFDFYSARWRDFIRISAHHKYVTMMMMMNLWVDEWRSQRDAGPEDDAGDHDPLATEPIAEVTEQHGEHCVADDERGLK